MIPRMDKFYFDLARSKKIFKKTIYEGGGEIIQKYLL